jgi:nucleotide-binding universal stress UspA family protein
MYQRILVPVDGSATAEQGLREAIVLGARLGAELVLLRVLPDDPMWAERAPAAAVVEARAATRRDCEAFVEACRRRATEAGVRARTAVREGDSRRVADVVLAEAAAQGCDLIVMGTHGRRGFDRLAVGSDAEAVVRGARAPVLMVRHPEAPR